MNVKIKLVRDGAKVPEYKTTWAAGCDLVACKRLVVESLERVVVPTGVSIELPAGYEAQVRGRSGLFYNSGLLVATGTIDADYRGEIGVMMLNVSQADRVIEAGDRIAQLVIAPVSRATFDVVKELSDTARGACGFGSTGQR